MNYETALRQRYQEARRRLWSGPPKPAPRPQPYAARPRPTSTEVHRDTPILFIQHLVAREFGVSREALVGPRGNSSVAMARHIAMYLARLLTDGSLPAIGRRFGGRDHTTVLHAVRRVEKLMQSDPALHARVERLATMARGAFR